MNMKWKTLTIVSLAFNVALIFWVTMLRSPQTPGAPPPVAARLAAHLSNLQVTPGNASNQAAFHWRELESADYLAYIANLRHIGCPEQTLRDIILADVNKLYAPRYAALAESAPELAWWGQFNKKRPVRPELATQLRALNDEKKALLERLLGTLTGIERAWLETGAASVREQNTFAFLPEAKQSAVQDLMSRYQALRERGETEWAGLTTDEREAKENALRDARARELAALLTPEELREFDLRYSPTSETLREQFGKANLTEAEFRQLYTLRSEFEKNVPEPKPEDWKRLESEQAAALGPDRFADVQRQNDAMWGALQSMAGERGLTASAMEQAYAIEQEYSGKLVQAVGGMFADPQQDPQPLRAIAAEMDARLAAALGPEAARQLDRLGVLPRLVVQDDGNHKNYTLTPGGFSN
jgi:hypothetical protein